MALNNPTSQTENTVTAELFQAWRERFILPLLIGTLIFGGIALIFAIQSVINPIIGSIFIATYVSVSIVTFIKFPYNIRITVILICTYVLGISELASHSILGDGLFFFLGVVVFAAMLLSPLAGAITIAINLATLAFFGWLMLNGNLIPANPNASPNVLSDWFAAAGVLLMYGGVIVFGFYQLEKAFDQSQRETQTALNALTDERNNLEKRVAERTRKLRRVNEIGRAVTSILNPEELLRRAAFMIGDEFECYYTAIYMMDISGNWAELREATGEAGLVLRENKHRVDVNGKTAIAQSVRTRQARLYQDVGPDAVRFDFPLLPYTRTQLTLPLLVGDIAIGVIEMHSSFESAFAQQDLDTFQNMANEIAIAIENSRLFNEAQQSLAEMRATQRQYLHGAWSALTTDKPISYEVGDESAGGKPLETPLSLRDQVIGDIFMASGDDWTPEQRNLIDSIAIQAALALENARLVEESQSIATRERMANEIIAKVWSSNTLDSILQTTVRELGRALEAAEVDIELSMDVNNNE